MDDPWRQVGRGVDDEERSWPRRAYFRQFVALAEDRAVRRAVVLVGPRRVGKTVSQAVRAGTARLRRTRHRRLRVPFDEIRHPKVWEIYLKSLIDSYPAAFNAEFADYLNFGGLPDTTRP
jgi:hypothetical protein